MPNRPSLLAASLMVTLACASSTHQPTTPADGPSEESTDVGAATTDVQAEATDDVCGDDRLTLEGRFTLSHYPGQDAVGPGGERPIGMSKEYVFTSDSYTLEAYPPLRVTGSYEVVARDGRRLTVRFTNTIFDGTPRDDRDVVVEFTDCGDTFVMEEMTYTRVTES